MSDMRRRQFITLLGGAAVTWPLVARAQQPVMPVIGYLCSASREDGPFRVGFHRGMKETGYVEGQNLVVINTADCHHSRLIWFIGKLQ
jgi:hypothetical protein